MTTKEMITWLETFEPDASVSVVCADVAARVHYPAQKCIFLADQAAIVVEVGGAKPLDIIEEAAP